MENPDLRITARPDIPCNNPGPMPATTNAHAAAPPRRHRPVRLLALTVTVVALVAACGSAGPSATPSTSTAPIPSAPPSTAPSAAPSQGVSGSIGPGASQDLATVYRQIEDQVIAIRQLQPKRPIEPTVLDGPGLQKLVSDGFDKDNPPELIAANQEIYQALGMLPKTANLKDLYVGMLGSQVAGLYNPDDKKLYVVSRSGKIGVLEKSTFSHEFTHALQDQNFDLGSLKLDEIGEGDRSFARLSLVEGDATLSMTDWQLQNLGPADFTELLRESQSDPSAGQLATLPAILRQSLLFPYIQGLAFVQGLQMSGGWGKVDDAFGHPPASTEQILHPEKYKSGELPVAVSLPSDLASRLGAGWSVPLVDTFGEFQLGVWLEQSAGIDKTAADAAAAGWGGDRVAAIRGPNNAWAVVLKTAWDTAKDASEFEAAAKPLVDALADPAQLLPGAGGTERWVLVGSDDATLNRVASTLGLAG
jgi:hypothetical protein